MDLFHKLVLHTSLVKIEIQDRNCYKLFNLKHFPIENWYEIKQRLQKLDQDSLGSFSDIAISPDTCRDRYRQIDTGRSSVWNCLHWFLNNRLFSVVNKTRIPWGNTQKFSWWKVVVKLYYMICIVWLHTISFFKMINVMFKVQIISERERERCIQYMYYQTTVT